MKNLLIEGKSLEWLLGAATDAMLIADASGKIALANPACERLFGLTQEQLLGQPVELLIPARFHHRHSAQRAEFSAQPRTRSMGAGAELFGLRGDVTDLKGDVTDCELTAAERAKGVNVQSLVMRQDD